MRRRKRRIPLLPPSSRRSQKSKRKGAGRASKSCAFRTGVPAPADRTAATNDLEGAYVGTFPAGSYTAIVSGEGRSTGVGPSVRCLSGAARAFSTSPSARDAKRSA